MSGPGLRPLSEVDVGSLADVGAHPHGTTGHAQGCEKPQDPLQGWERFSLKSPRTCQSWAQTLRHATGVCGRVQRPGTSGSLSWTPQMLLDVSEELRTERGRGHRQTLAQSLKGKGAGRRALAGFLREESPWLAHWWLGL